MNATAPDFSLRSLVTMRATNSMAFLLLAAVFLALLGVATPSPTPSPTTYSYELDTLSTLGPTSPTSGPTASPTPGATDSPTASSSSPPTPGPTTGGGGSTVLPTPYSSNLRPSSTSTVAPTLTPTVPTTPVLTSEDLPDTSIVDESEVSAGNPKYNTRAMLLMWLGPLHGFLIVGATAVTLLS